MATWTVLPSLPATTGPKAYSAGKGDLDVTMDSDNSTTSHVSFMAIHNSLTSSSRQNSGPLFEQPDSSAMGSQHTKQQQQLQHAQAPTGSEASAAVPSANGQAAGAVAPRHAPRKCQGYRKLWTLVNRVQRGQRLAAPTEKEDVTVEDLIKMIQQLPAPASAVEAITPGLNYLDSRAAAALLKGLAKAGMGLRAVEIFDYLRGLPPEHDLAPLCDIFTYTTMISQCNSHHQLRRALELVAEMRSRAVPLNVHTYSALLNVCLKANELDLSLDVYTQMLAEGVTPNLVTYNTLLDIYNKTGRWMDALNVLELLQHQNIRPEARTYNAIISTCNAAGRYAEAVRVYDRMTAAGIEPNGASYNAALTSFARSGQLEAALNLFGVMGTRGFERGANTYAAVLAACERPGRWDVALKLLHQMQADGVRPSSACLTSAINACLHGGQPARAEELFDRLCSVCKPDAATFNCLVCVYCRLGKVREAANMLEIMLRSGQHVDLTTYDAAIDTCWATGVVPLQHYAQQLYERARQQGLYQTVMTKQVCAAGFVLDLQLPGGPPHVVLISLLQLMSDLQEQSAGLLSPPAGQEGAAAKVLLRLAVQGQDAATLGHMVSSQLRSLGSPFVSIDPVPTAALAANAGAAAAAPSAAGSPVGEELHYVAEASAVAEWLQGAPVALALSQLVDRQPASSSASTSSSSTSTGGVGGGVSGRRRSVDGLLVCQQDAQREAQCRQAMMSVQALEESTAINAQAIPQTLLLQRAELVQLLLRNTLCLGLSPEVGHDAVQLMDRLLASPSITALAASIGSGPLLAAACLCAVSRQDLATTAASMCASVFGVQAQQLLLAVSQVHQVLGSRGAVAISAMRVLQLLLERLGVNTRDPAAALQVCGNAMALLNHAAMLPAFIGCPPSVTAVAVLHVSRLAAGLLPAWPAALAHLTGYSETHAALQPYIQAAAQLLLEV